MKFKVGVDIVSKKRFLKSYKRGKEGFLGRLFTPQELKQNSIDQLVSIFCLKEAVMKALELPQDSWLTISTNRTGNGKVDCSFVGRTIARKIISLDTSISHDAGLIIGVAVIVVE